MVPANQDDVRRFRFNFGLSGVRLEMDGKIVKLPWWRITLMAAVIPSGPVFIWKLPEIIKAIGF